MKLHIVLGAAVLLLSAFIGGDHLVLAGAPSSAHAANALVQAHATPVTGKGPGESPGHCVSWANGHTDCYATEAEALYAASDGRIKLAPGQTSKDLTDEELFGTDTDVRAVLYEHADYGGATLSLRGNCGGWNNMLGAWNDAVSSARSYSCGSVTIYQHNNLAGAGLCILPPGITYVGDSMNDTTSSWSVP
ncbi:MAG TPA: hypothetical protein VGE45_13765 [Chloroflexia bacterium]|jgi:hypothetical protein